MELLLVSNRNLLQHYSLITLDTVRLQVKVTCGDRPGSALDQHIAFCLMDTSLRKQEVHTNTSKNKAKLKQNMTNIWKRLYWKHTVPRHWRQIPSPVTINNIVTCQYIPCLLQKKWNNENIISLVVLRKHFTEYCMKQQHWQQTQEMLIIIY